MSTSATDYYGYLMSMGYSQDQLEKFSSYCEQAKKGEITMNQAYKKSKDAGWSNGDGKIGAFLEDAKESGWIDKGFQIFGDFINRNKGGSGSTSYTPPPQEKSKVGLYVLGGVVVIGMGVALYFAFRKK